MTGATRCVFMLDFSRVRCTPRLVIAQKPPSSESGASGGFTACFKTGKSDVGLLIGFGCLAILFLLFGGRSVQPFAVEAGAQPPPSDGACYIPPERAVRVRVNAGEKAWTTCVNGQVWVLVARQPDATNDDFRRRNRRRSGDESSAVTVFGVQAKGDNSAASAVWPVAPGQNECQAVPQPPNAPATAVATASPSSSTGAPALGLISPFEIGSGVPASPPLVAAVIGVLREATACANAGDLVRLSALYTEEAATRAAARGFSPFVWEPHAPSPPGGETPATPGLMSPVPTAAAQPSPDNESAQTPTVSQLRLLPLGYITALLSRSDLDGVEQQYTIVFAFNDGQLLIADVIDDAGPAPPAP